MTQINTPYPATAYLTGFLRQRNYTVTQADPAIELFLRLFSRAGVEAMREEIQARYAGVKPSSASLRHFIHFAPVYAQTVDSVIRFLQGRDPTLAHRIVSGGFLPEGPRFSVIEELDANVGEGLPWAFGEMGISDRAQYLASLYVDDLADVIREGIDPKFELSRYGEKLAVSSASFDGIAETLAGNSTLVDRMLDDITLDLLNRNNPDVVGITIPFPGNVYGAFRIAKVIKENRPRVKVVLGGGYVNTELRDLQEPRVFDYVDYVTLDDGERPFLAILESLENQSPKWLRTFVREAGKVIFKTDPSLHDIPFRDSATPTYEGLPLDRYPSLCEMLNPMHRLWSDGRWNKLTIAHGCYWKKCTFCDTSLDYINRYEDLSADLLVDRIEALVKETGRTGFHFVDEAAPPKALLAMAKKLLERKVTISWWGNIRFEKTFTPELCATLAQSGCVAISGGLEVASDRLLDLMEKGVSVEQVARVTHAFTQAGIMVHAYLMYGFPSQTVQETVDSLERVRQLFSEGCLQSAFWHRFSVTAHSPIGQDPGRYGLTLLPVNSTFARNDLPFEDRTGVDHDALQPGLRKALYSFMHGMGLEEDVRNWFDFAVPKAKVPKTLIRAALSRSGRAHEI